MSQFIKTQMMKKLLPLLIGLISVGSYAQTFQPIIGLNYSGGINYGMDAELFSGKAGILYTPKLAGKFHDQPTFISNVELSGNFYYDFYPKNQLKKYTYYLAKVQVAHQIAEFWNIVAYGGYANNFTNDIMKHYAGEFKTNLSYGAGLQTFDDNITAEVIIEELAGYPRLSVGVIYKFGKTNKK